MSSLPAASARRALTPPGFTWNDFLAAGLRASRRRWDRLRRACRKKPSPGAVHALRIETRRLLGWGELAGAVGRRAISRTRRKLRRALRATNALRDALVQMRAVEALRRTRPAVEPFYRHLRRRYRRAARAVQGASELRIHGVRLRRLERAVAAVEDPRRAAAAVARTLQQASAGLAAAVRSGRRDPRRLHHARIAVKGLRYLVEALRPALPPGAATWRNRLVVLQRRLGAIHDLDVLLARLDRYRRRRPGHRHLQALAVILRRRRRRLVSRFRSLQVPPPPPARRAPGQAAPRTAGRGGS